MFDIGALYKLLKRDFDVYKDVRSALDVLYLITKEPRATLTEVQKVCPDIKLSSLEECEKKAPDYLSIGLCESTKEVVLFSKVLKRHFSSEMFRKKMMENQEIDQISLSSRKAKESLSVNRVAIDILKQPFSGLLPTRNYKDCGEVYVVSDDLITELSSLYPSHNIQSEINSIFEYLVKTPIARKPATSMKHFIKKWISGDLLMNAKQAKRQQKLDAKHFYAELKEHGI